MLTARAFWMVRRSVGFDAGSAPPAFTVMVRSLAMRANCFAMRFQRANIVALRTSKMRPMPAWCTNAGARAKAPRGIKSVGLLKRPRSHAIFSPAKVTPFAGVRSLTRGGPADAGAARVGQLTRRVAPAGCACAAAAGSGGARYRALGHEAADAPRACSLLASD